MAKINEYLLDYSEEKTADLVEMANAAGFDDELEYIYKLIDDKLEGFKHDKNNKQGQLF